MHGDELDGETLRIGHPELRVHTPTWRVRSRGGGMIADDGASLMNGGGGAEGRVSEREKGRTWLPSVHHPISLCPEETIA